MPENREPPQSIGPYRLEARLGGGGMGEVYRAFDERLKRRVALKLIHPDRATRPGARRHLLREARVAARLNHPALVHVHDILEIEDGDLCIVMELVEGEPLSRLLERGGLEPGRALALAAEVASGLAAAHAAGVLHRDLKSENVVVGRDGHAKVLDFGLARPLAGDDRDASLSADGRLSGTPRAMSPEQVRGGELDHRSDLFALGVLVYELVAGRSPFLAAGTAETLARICHEPHEPLTDVVPGLPRELSRWVDRLLAKDPAGRPESAAEVAEELRRLARELAPAAEAPPPPGRKAAERAARRAVAGERRLSGERRRLTLLCCDLVGGGEGTSSGSLDPELLSEVLPGFQRLVTAAVERYEGHVGDVLGHRLVIYFGYPHAHEDDARRAALAALEIVDRAAGLNARLEGPRTVAARAGIHTGPAVALTSPREHLALGATLDLATALQERAVPGVVVVSAVTRRLIEGLFDDEELEELATEEGGRVWRLRAARAVHSRVEAQASLLPLVGRRRELELCADRFALAREGSGQTVLLAGEAGVGKTRLVRSLAERLADAGPRWLTLYGSAHTRHQAFHPAADLLGQMLEASRASPDERRSRLEAILREHDFPLAETVPPLAALLDLPEARGLPEARWRRQVLEVLPALVLEQAEHRATVLVCEDLQWTDPATLELIGRLVDQGTSAALFLVLTCRPGFVLPWGPRAHLTRLHLDPLDGVEVEALIEQLGGGALSTEARAEVGRRADGVPLFVEELVRDALDAPSAGARDGPSVPPALEGLLTARLDRLGAAKELAQRAAWAADELTFDDLAALSGLDEMTLADELDRLLAGGVFVRRGTDPETWAFRHVLLREAASASVLEGDRERLRRYSRSPRSRG